MRRALLVAPLLALSLTSARPYRIRFALNGQAADRRALSTAMLQGMFADSLIARSTTPLPAKIDYSDPTLPSTVIVRGNVVTTDDTISVKLDLLNVLGQKVVSDSLHSVPLEAR